MFSPRGCAQRPLKLGPRRSADNSAPRHSSARILPYLSFSSRRERVINVSSTARCQLVGATCSSDLRTGRRYRRRTRADLSTRNRTPAEWDFNTIPQSELNNRELYQPRGASSLTCHEARRYSWALRLSLTLLSPLTGKMLGGCSAINAMIFQQPTRDDLDQASSSLLHSLPPKLTSVAYSGSRRELSDGLTPISSPT